MNDNHETMNNAGASIPPNAVSLYGHGDAMDDFPVLKAFQQYIDAEQAKAQKRMTTLCIFFALILAIVIGVFVLLLMNVGQRNQTLNDQLLQYVMKDRDREPIVVQNGAPANNDATVKMLTDSLAAMQKQMAEQQAKMLEQQAKMLEQQMKTIEQKSQRALASPSKPAVDPAAEQKKKADVEKLKKAAAALAAEKAKLAQEKEELRKAKVEMHRRKLYPEYYAQTEGGLGQKEEAKKTENPLQTEERADGSIRYFDDEDELEAPEPTPKPKKVVEPAPTPKAEPPPQKKLAPLPAAASLKLENSDDTALSGWEIPLD